MKYSSEKVQHWMQLMHTLAHFKNETTKTESIDLQKFFNVNATEYSNSWYRE